MNAANKIYLVERAGYILFPLLVFLISFTPSTQAATVGFSIGTSADGVVILGLDEDGPAYRAGVRRLDILKNIDGVEINSVPQVLDVLKEKAPSKLIPFIIFRDGKKLSTNVRVSGKDVSEYKITEYDLDYANDLFLEKHSHDDAIKIWKYWGDTGTLGGYFNIGFVYDKNLDSIGRDTDKAIAWYTKAAEKGHKDSQVNLGHLLYETSQYEASIKWLKLGAEYENTKSQAFLGNSYRNGSVVEKNIPLAMDLLEKAALKGDGHAAYLLGYMYQYGKDISYDLDKAKYWYKIAVDNGDTKSQSHLDNLDSFWFRMTQSAVNSTVEVGKATIELAKENPEAAAVIGAVIVGGTTAYLNSDDVCFLPNDAECNDEQEANHESFLNTLMDDFIPTFGKCGDIERFNSFLKSSVHNMSFVTAETAYIALTGDTNAIFADLIDLHGAVNANNGC